MSETPPKFRRQVTWSLIARILAAGLGLIIVMLLARGLAPRDFAFVASIQVFLQVIVAVNGFGLSREMQVRRAKDPADPEIPRLFSQRLVFSYSSAVLWGAVLLGLGIVTGQHHWFAVLPTALWLVAEQTTMVWNAISTIDGRTHLLISSYATRRIPTIISLALALNFNWDVTNAWAWGLGISAVLAYVQGVPSQEGWARMLIPARFARRSGGSVNLAYWWSAVANEVRNLDVPAVSLVEPLSGGLYALPARILGPMSMIPQAVGSVAFPSTVRASRLTARLVLRVVALGVAPVVVAAATLAGAAGHLPTLLGSEYAGAVTPLRVQCIVVCLAAVSFLLTTILQARGEDPTRFAGVANLSCAAAQVCFAALGAVLMGAVGAALGAVASQGALVLLLAMAVSRLLRREADHRP